MIKDTPLPPLPIEQGQFNLDEVMRRLANLERICSDRYVEQHRMFAVAHNRMNKIEAGHEEERERKRLRERKAAKAYRERRKVAAATHP